MEVREAIVSRRSVRKYLDKNISEEDLREILEMAVYAPSAVNRQPWYFVAVHGREKMTELLETMTTVSDTIAPALNETFEKHPEVAAETTGFIRSLGNAPVCVLVFKYRSDYENPADNINQSVAAAIENLLLAATEKGIGSCWMTAPVEAGKGKWLRERFAPDKGELVAIVTLGYPDGESRTPRRKEGRYIII